MIDPLRIYRMCDGKPGLDLGQSFSGHLFDAMAVIDSARAHLAAEDTKRSTS